MELMTPELLHAELLASGFSLRVDGGKILVSPAAKLTPDLRARIASGKEELLALLVGSFCPKGHELQPKGICWKCLYRRCSQCGRDTGSAFIELCNPCGNKDEFGVSLGAALRPLQRVDAKERPVG